MLKFFIVTLFSLSLLHASEAHDHCTQDLSQILSTYYKADNNKQKNDFLTARENYEVSLKSAYSALESCMGHEDYNFEMIYRFIQKNQEGIESTQE